MQGNKGKEIACQARAMGAMQAISAATRTNAALMRDEKEAGTVEAGKREHQIVHDTDQLDDRDPRGGAVCALAGVLRAQDWWRPDLAASRTGGRRHRL